MTHWTVTFVVLALIAGILGFGTMGNDQSLFCQALFIVFSILCYITVIIGKIKITH
nr:DUF1328 family protein [Flavobacterium sp. ASV13]